MNDHNPEETPEQVEWAILRGLQYLAREALAAKLKRLAAVIESIVGIYLTKDATRETSNDGSPGHHDNGTQNGE